MKPTREFDRGRGNTRAPAGNYTPLTLHELTKPSAKQRVGNASTKPARDKPERKSTGVSLYANPKSHSRGPGRRQKLATIGKS